MKHSHKKVIKLLKKILKYIILLPIVPLLQINKERKINNNIYKHILSNVNNIEKTVIIFQNSFFSQDGEKFYSGGAERYCLDLANIIISSGYEPLLIQNSSIGFWSQKKNNLKVLGINKFKYFCSHKMFENKQSKPAFMIFSGMCFVPYKCFENSIIISHGIAWDHKTVSLPKYTRLKNMLKYNTNIVSVDTNTISFFRSLFANESKNKNFYYIPNYVDTKIFKPSNKNSNKIKILFPRRLCNYRGYWLCSEIMDNVMQLNDNIEFDFVGFIHDNEIENDLNNLQNKYKNRIHHYLLEPEQMSELYKNYDISLIPTLYSEGTSLSCLEAQASGNVVIATNIGGLPNLIINNYNGILINPNAKELFNAIRTVVENKDFRDKLSKNALIVSQEFSKEQWEKSWAKILSKYI